MALSIRNQFVGKTFKGAFVICTFFSVVMLEPFQPFISHADMAGNLVFTLTIIPLLMGPLLPIGIAKAMKKTEATPVKFDGFLYTISTMMPRGMLGKAIFWTIIGYVLVGLPAIFAFNLWEIESMTGHWYLIFKVLTTNAYATFLTYLISSACVSEAAHNHINMRV